MYPWLFWAPHIHFPYSGSFAQSVEPNTNWFFNAIRPEAGIADVERRVFDVASYGRQLGLITEVLLAMADPQAIDKKKTNKSLERLKEIYHEIEKVKEESEAQVAETAIALLDKLRTMRSRELGRILQRYAALPDMRDGE
jgi:hypothetical protein